jgi:thiol-disulfide isomerase/thioredoxin
MKNVNAAECREIIQNHPYVVIKFGNKWCKPCATLSRTIDALSDAFPNIRFLEIDTTEDLAYAKEFDVTNIPALFFAAHGSLVTKDDGTKKRLKGVVDSIQLREEFTRLQNILVDDNQGVKN